MANPFWLIAVLLISVVFIILGTTKLKIHPFITLLLASYIAGMLTGLPAVDIATVISAGFGSIMTSIGIVIIFGTFIGVILEKSGAAIKLAELVLKVVGKRYPALAMSIIGYIVSIPVFCDSGFIILSSVRKSLAAKTGKSPVVLSIALGTGLYATHTFVPPTPGPIAAAGNLGLENQLGLVILAGLIVAVFAMVSGYFWSIAIGEKHKLSERETADFEEFQYDKKLPSATKSLLPIVIPVLLIAIRSIATFPSQPFGEGILFSVFNFAGQPVNALIIGFLSGLFLMPKLNKETLTGWMGEGITAAAPILLITGAGGAFGAILKETHIGETIGSMLANYHLGIFLPFIIAAAFKTAQGSTTVAMVATSALIAPLLAGIGLDSTYGRVLTVMATGAGAMTISHVNDSFFWVVTQFTGMDVKTGIKTFTTATFLQGIVTMGVIYFMRVFLI